MTLAIYRPSHRTQKRADDPWRMYNCSAYSLAMALDRASLGGIGTSGESVRARTNEPRPDPQSPGLSLLQLDKAALAWSVTMEYKDGRSWAEFLRDIKQGRGAILNGDRDELGPPICPDPFKGLHSVYVNQVKSDGDLLVYDPLCDKPYWLPSQMVKEYAQKYGRSIRLPSGTVRYLATRITPLVQV